MNNAVAQRGEISPQITGYLTNEIMGLSSTEIILKIYDFAIINLKKREQQKAMRAITELIVSLNFDYKDFSIGLYKLYQYCRDQIIHGNFDNALVILEGLRDSWAKAFDLERG
jgi:flagellin-specific chaperone FliS